MIIVDAQLSPHLAIWVSEKLSVETYSVSFLGMLNSTDSDIFHFAREKNAVVITKDNDFVSLLYRLGPPPKIIWITCGNTSNAHMKRLLKHKLTAALKLLDSSDLVEIAD